MSSSSKLAQEVITAVGPTGRRRPSAHTTLRASRSAPRRTVPATAFPDTRHGILAHQTMDAIFVIDRNTLRVVDANASASTLTGYSHAELVGAPVARLVPAEGRKAQVFRFNSASTSASPVTRTQYRRKDGQVLEVEVHQRRLDDMRVLGVVHELATAAGVEPTPRYLLTSFDLFAATIDRQGRISDASPALSALTGYSLKELIGRDAYELLPRGPAVESIGPVSDEHLTANLNPPIICEIVTRSGERRPITINATLLHDQLGRMAGVAVLGQDLSLAGGLEAGLEREVRERADVAAAMSRLQPGGSVQETAQAICRELRGLNGVDFSVVVVFKADGDATILAIDAPKSFPVRQGQQLPAPRAQYLIERTATGPWAERWSQRVEDGDYGRQMTHAGLQGSSYAPIRYGDNTLGVLVVGSLRDGAADAMIQHLPVIAEFGATASALLALDLQADRVLVQRRERIQQIVSSMAFQPVFQTIVDVGSGEVVGYEALTRFLDREPPDAHFSSAWSVGLGPELELATLERAVRVSQLLPPHRWLNINVSPKLVADPDRLRPVLERAQRPLVLEITEHEIVHDYRALREALRELGPVRTAVDDAGAGIANFAHIVELHADFVKLDVGLVRGVAKDPARQAMIVALRHFAGATGCRLIAEGVETKADAKAMRSLEVDFAQGYWYGRPSPVESLVAMPGPKREASEAVAPALATGPRAQRGVAVNVPVLPV